MFNIITQLHSEIQDFNQNKIKVISNDRGDGNAKYLTKASNNYDFSQKDTLNTIEMYYNSIFKSGKRDREGQLKVFLNICKFRADVATKQVDLDLKDFLFIPENYKSSWGSYFLTKKFRAWAKEGYFSELLNSISVDYAKYGSAVVKRVGSKLERVPIHSLINKQDAEDLATADYVIQEHKNMSFSEIEAMKNWDTDGLEMKWGEKVTVYERYGQVPLDWYKKEKDEEVEAGDDKRSIDVMAILVPDKKDKKSKGNMLFMEKIDKRPYEEVHWSRVDGRWLGVGEIENQFDNQVMQNMIANMRRRGLLWSSKKIFQSPDEQVAKNLVRDVKDGDVLQIMPNGQISQVNMTTQNLAEFNATQESWERNSDQKSFTFEVATGESLPSGTPFRLGVLLTNATNSHFQLKRENLGLFWKKAIKEQIYPQFKKDNKKEHTLTLFADEEGVNSLKETLIRVHSNKEMLKVLLEGKLPNTEEITAQVRQQIEEREKLFMKIPEGFYDNIDANISLVVTGEEVDIPKKIETLTNLYNVLAQQQDPRAETVLNRIMSLTGENFDALVGPKPQPQQQLQQAQASSLAQPQVQPQTV